MNKIVTLIFIILTFSSAFANSFFVLKEKDESVDLSGKLSIYVDEARRKTLSDLINSNQFGFGFTKLSHNSFGYTKANCWIKTDFKYVGNALRDFYFVLPIPLTYSVNFYLTDETGKIIKQTNTGCQYPFSMREEESRYFVFGFTPEIDRKYTFYCMAHNDFGALNVPLKLMSQESFNKFDDLESYTLFGFMSLLFIAFLASMALFINLKDRIYLYYAGYLISILLIRFSLFGFAFKYIHPEHPEFAILSKIIFWLLGGAFFINFVIRLLSSAKVYFVRAQKIFTIQTYVYLTILSYILISYAFWGITNNTFNTCVIYFMHLNFTVSLIITLIITYRSFVNGFGPAKYFAFAFIPLVLILLSTMFSNFGIMPQNFITNYPIEIGVTIEILFLSAALISRYKIIVLEKYSLEYKLIEIERQMKEKELRESEPMEKYQNSKYTLEELEGKRKDLSNYIVFNKSYLDEGMNINRLAELTGINSHQISQIINRIENKNFFDYMNSFRVEYAMKLLLDEKFDNYSVEGIGYECGFQTKATFYSTFKKVTGITPAEYRKRQLQA